MNVTQTQFNKSLLACSGVRVDWLHSGQCISLSCDPRRGSTLNSQHGSQYSTTQLPIRCNTITSIVQRDTNTNPETSALNGLVSGSPLSAVTPHSSPMSGRNSRRGRHFSPMSVHHSSPMSGRNTSASGKMRSSPAPIGPRLHIGHGSSVSTNLASSERMAGK